MFLLLVVPVICFYIGKAYQEVATLPIVTVETFNTKDNWTRVNISENEAEQLFTAVHEYMLKQNPEYVYYSVVLDKLQNNSAYIQILPKVEEKESLQIYMKKNGGVWGIEK